MILPVRALCSRLWSGECQKISQSSYICTSEQNKFDDSDAVALLCDFPLKKLSSLLGEAWQAIICAGACCLFKDVFLMVPKKGRQQLYLHFQTH